MSTPSAPAKKRRFYHRHFIDSDLNPSLCEVTHVAQGLVYYALLENPKERKSLNVAIKASLKAHLDYFMRESLGYWEDETLPHSKRALALRRWAANNDIREVLPLSDRARLVAEYLHQEDRDKAGVPYMNHVQAVADQVEGEDEKVVAYLHDTKEDHHLSDRDFEWLGFEPDQIFAINGVTKLPNEKGEAGYHAFVSRAARHPVSRAVKLADLRDNATLDRIPASMRTEHDIRRTEKYQREIAFLQSLPALSTLPEEAVAI